MPGTCYLHPFSCVCMYQLKAFKCLCMEQSRITCMSLTSHWRLRTVLPCWTLPSLSLFAWNSSLLCAQVSQMSEVKEPAFLVTHTLLVSAVCQCPPSTLWFQSPAWVFLELLSTSFLPREVPQTLSFLNITLSKKLIKGFLLSNFSFTPRNVNEHTGPG